MRKFVMNLILLSAIAVNTGCVGIFAAGVLTGAGQYIKYSMHCLGMNRIGRESAVLSIDSIRGDSSWQKC